MKKKLAERRRGMVQAVRDGCSMRAVSRQFGVALRTVQVWVERAKGKRLDRVDFSDRSHAPRRTTRTVEAVESQVLRIRRDLVEVSALGERGAVAIRAALVGVGEDGPSLRTIGRILARHGVLDGAARIRRPPPPRGWYLPDVSRGVAELDSFDAVVGLVIAGGTDVEVLNGVSLHSGLVGSWPLGSVTAKATVEALIEHWGHFGLPTYAQFDNDTRFQGAHQFRDTFGRVIRLCLGLGVVPVFAPPRELGFQAAVESYNGRWQAKVWSRFQHVSLGELQERSKRLRRSAPASWSCSPCRCATTATISCQLEAGPSAAIGRPCCLPSPSGCRRSRLASRSALRRRRHLAEPPCAH